MRFPKLNSQALLSPMAGVTDVAFRTLAKRYGAGMTCTEFVSSTALVRENAATEKLIVTDPSEKPVAVQVFGSSMDDVVLAGKRLSERFDVIDINCGCPAWKVVKTGAGAELLKNPKGIHDFVARLVKEIDKPVTIKIRAGPDKEHINAVEVAKLAEEAGAAAVAVHGRTAKQGYQGDANWEIIKSVKEVLSIPVIGNGDVFSPETFKYRLEESGVDAILIARGAIGNPYIFRQIQDYLRKGSYEKISGLEQFSEYLKIAKRYGLETTQVKQQAIQFTKGIVGGARLRLDLSSASEIDQIEKVMAHSLSTS